jgi:hypothetical protein
MAKARTHPPRTMLPPRIEALSAHIREHWGKIPVMQIAALAGESYSLVTKRAAEMDMPRLKQGQGGASATAPAIPPLPKGIPEATLSWARASASVNREAAMILALSGKDVRKLGWR